MKTPGRVTLNNLPRLLAGNRWLLHAAQLGQEAKHDQEDDDNRQYVCETVCLVVTWEQWLIEETDEPAHDQDQDGQFKQGTHPSWS